MKQRKPVEALAARRQVSSEEAAEFLGISIRKLEKYRREGDGPVAQVGQVSHLRSSGVPGAAPARK